MQIHCKSNQNTNNILHIIRKILNFTWNEEGKKDTQSNSKQKKNKKEKKMLEG